jgi:ABC-type sugar transport system, periplasmic component
MRKASILAAALAAALGLGSAAAEPIKVSVFIQKQYVDSWATTLKDRFEAANPDIRIEWNVLPGTNIDAFTKMDLSVLSGDSTDIILLQNPNHYSKYVSGKLLMPLNELAKQAGYSIDKVYGGYAKKYENGTVYWLPDSVTMNIVYYNKGIFDAAHVPYPSGAWSWDDYVGIAKKLNNPSKGIYGSLMELDWEYYNYILANQKKVSAYKADGSSNFDDPAWRQSLKWLGELSTVHKIQPSLPEFKAKKLQPDSFFSGKFGMEMIGSWMLDNATQYDTYPRDWKIGVCAPPANADGKNILSAGGGFGINKNSAHPKEAFKFVTYLCENAYLLDGGLPARIDVGREELLKVFQDTSKRLKGEVSAEDLLNAIYPSYLGVANEKIIGTASAQINDLVAREAEKYFFGTQSLDVTMKNLKTKADDFIAKAK